MKLLALILAFGFAAVSLAAVLPLVEKIAQKKLFKLSDFSDIDDVVPEKLKKRFGEFVKKGLGNSEKELLNIRRKLKIIKKLAEAESAGKNTTTTFGSSKKKLLAHVGDPDLNELVFEDDMLLDESQLDDIINGAAHELGIENELLSSLGVSIRPKRQALRNTYLNPETGKYHRLWALPIGFHFDDNLNDQTKDVIRESIKNLENQTCLTFDEDETKIPRLQFKNVAASCISIVGFSSSTAYTSGCTGCGNAGQHPINIGGDWCDNETGVITHEILHALGIHHHQDRHDRDKFVLNAGRFIKLTTDNSYNYGTPYEYGSVLHYAKELEAVNPLYQHTLGQRNGPTFGDIALLNARYQCACTSPTVTCVNGGYPNPNNCGRCNCPGGWGGTTCSNRNTGTEGAGAFYGVSRTDSCHTLTYSLGTDDDIEHLYQKTVWYHFQAPPGKKVQFIVLKATDKDNSDIPGCKYYGVEMKLKKAEWNRTGYVFCANDKTFVTTSFDDVKAFTSDNERAMLQFYTRRNKLDVIIKYRVVDSDTESDIPDDCKPQRPCEDIEPEGTQACIDWEAAGAPWDCASDYDYMKENCYKTCGFCQA
jgi:hypothetical protein